MLPAAETAGAAADAESAVPAQPNYITPRGLATLKARLVASQQQLAALGADAVAQREATSQTVRSLQSRIACAIEVLPRDADAARVSFGATVELRDEEGLRQRFHLVGEDEADPSQHRVSWLSPLARALIGASVGDCVTWQGPDGDRELTVLAIDYG